jgi:hypothetical protein
MWGDVPEDGMTNFEVWFGMVEMLMGVEGCLVLGSREERSVGELIEDRLGYGVSYRVEGEATAGDALRQLNLIEAYAGCKLQVPEEPRHFYKTRMVTN